MPFLSDVAYLPYFHLVLSYNLDALGTNTVSLSEHRAIRRNSESIELQNIGGDCSKYKAYAQ